MGLEKLIAVMNFITGVQFLDIYENVSIQKEVRMNQIHNLNKDSGDL